MKNDTSAVAWILSTKMTCQSNDDHDNVSASSHSPSCCWTYDISKVQNENSKVNICCFDNSRKRALCTMRTKMSNKSEINADSVSATECFRILVSHGQLIVSSSHQLGTTIATDCRSRSLQTISQSQWPKVDLINDHQTNRRLCNWRIKISN